MFIKIMKNPSVALMMSQGIEKSARAIQAILMARALNLEMFGKISFFFAIMLIQFIISDLGITHYVTREISKKKDRLSEYFGNELKIKAVTLVFTLLVLLIVSGIFGSKLLIGVMWILISSMICFAEHTLHSAFSILRSFERFHIEAFAKTIKCLLDLVVVAMVCFYDFALITIPIAIAVTASLVAAPVFIHTIKCYGRPDLKGIDVGNGLRTVINALPFFLINMTAIILNRVDTLMIGRMMSYDDAGLYEAGSTFSRNLGLFAITIVLPFFPRFSKYSNQFNKIKPLLLKLLGHLVIAMCFFVTLQLLAGKFIILEVFGNKFLPAIPTMYALSLATIPVFLNLAICYFISAISKNGINVVVLLSSIFINIALNYILIPWYGILGSAVATVVSELFTTSIFLVYLAWY